MIKNKSSIVDTDQGKSQGSFENIFIKLAPVVMIVAAVILVALFVEQSRTTQVIDETGAYIRVSNCIDAKVASPPTTQEEVEKCYVQVEKQTGISLQRFDE